MTDKTATKITSYEFCYQHMLDLATTRKQSTGGNPVLTTDIENIAFIRMSICDRPDGMDIPTLDLIKAMFAACAHVNAQ